MIKQESTTLVINHTLAFFKERMKKGKGCGELLFTPQINW